MGDPASSVHLTGAFAAGSPPFDVPASVIERRGCDLSPVDTESEEGRLTLLSFVWAAQWLDRNLSSVVPGAATVVFHSIVAPYMSESSYKQLVDVLSRAGKAATKAAPLAWLRMEPGSAQADVRLTIWPEGEERIIATTSFHGRDIRWLVEGSGR